MKTAIVLALLLLAAESALAQSSEAVAELRAANAALIDGDGALAARSAERALASHSLEQSDRAEAYRILGIARLALGDAGAAEAAFLIYLKLDSEARLDPALVPPEVLVFFEDVRSRHAAELRRYRPSARPTGNVLLSALPPLGQWQNGQRGKALAIGAIGGALLATNLATYFLVRSWCDSEDNTCGAGDSRFTAARRLKRLNLGSGLGLLVVYAYGVIDGAVVHRRLKQQHARRMSVGLAPAPGGLSVSVELRF